MFFVFLARTLPASSSANPHYAQTRHRSVNRHSAPKHSAAGCHCLLTNSRSPTQANPGTAHLHEENQVRAEQDPQDVQICGQLPSSTVAVVHNYHVHVHVGVGPASRPVDCRFTPTAFSGLRLLNRCFWSLCCWSPLATQSGVGFCSGSSGRFRKQRGRRGRCLP